MKPIRNVPGGLLIISGLVAALNFLHAQETAAPIQGGAVSLTPATLPSIQSYSDAQLEQLLKTLAATPLIWPNALPDNGRAGTYWSLAHPNFPPLPTAFNTPFWNLTSSSTASGSSFYLLDDVDYPPSPGGDGGTNVYIYNFQPIMLTSNDLYLKMVSVTNQTANLIIHPPWNVTNGVYDLLYCTNLDAPIAWQWLLRTDPGQTNLVVPNATDAQGFYRLGSPDDLTANDSLGTNFWVAFFNMHADNGLSLYISSPAGANGTVTIPGLGITNAFSVAAGAVANVGIPPEAMIFDYDAVENYGIQVTASQPVSVYGFNYDAYDSAAFTCYPTTLLGTNYCVMAYESTAPGNYSQFAIVATADDTTVTITPSPTADLAGSLWTNSFTLQQGETYQNGGGTVGDDATGTWITSDKPVGVFAGDTGAYVPDVYVYFGNPLVQEQMPIEDWGTNVLALSFAGRMNGDTYRVLAACSNTVVTITGNVVTIVDDMGTPAIVTTNYETVVVTNQAGQFYQINIDGPVEFQGSKPIQVAQFANGTQFDNLPDGDPCEILLPRTGHYLETNVVFIPTNLDPDSGLIAFDEIT